MNEICCADCGTRGQLKEDDFGYTVVCPNPKCDGVQALAPNPACPTKAAAWHLWEYMNGVKV